MLIFDKTYQERLSEYLDIFAGYEDLSACKLKEIWSCYLELVVDPSSWQALWKISRTFCENLHISFPTVVLVSIQQIDYKELTALVEILAVQDDIHLPENHLVPLVQLWPTKEQDKSLVLNLKSTASALDALRFFYNNLLLPWDFEEGEGINWVSEHLEIRLRLHYDMSNGLMPFSTVEQIRGLITEAKRLEWKREILERDLQSDVEEELNVGQETALLKIQVRLSQIKSEFELLENPFTRNILLMTPGGDVPIAKNSFHLVFNEGTADDCIKFLQEIKTYYPYENFKFSPNLDATLEIANKSDTVILQRNVHSVKHLGALEAGGTLQGLPGTSDTTLTSQNEDIMLEFSGQVTLENLTIQVDSAQYGILVRRGKLLLNNCKLMGAKASSTSHGILVLSNAEIELIGCDIGGFRTAIVGNSKSAVSLKNCDIHDANIGLKIHENCRLSVQSTKLRDCREYGVCVESEKERSQVTDFDALRE